MFSHNCNATVVIATSFDYIFLLEVNITVGMSVGEKFPQSWNNAVKRMYTFEDMLVEFKRIKGFAINSGGL